MYWTAEINNDFSTAAIYYATTDDFINFSEPKVLYRDTVGILDANITKVNGGYNLIYRKNNSVWVVASHNATGPYTNAYLLAPDNVEGPFAFPLNDRSVYGIVWDYYGGSAGFGLITS